MTDQYLCRGRTKSGKWVEGYVLPMPNTETVKILVWCKSYMDCGEGKQEFDVYDVDPSTVGRCTGLRDKNGKLIFKDDLIRSYEGSVGRITFGAYNDDDEDYYAYGWYWVGVSGKAKGKHLGFDPAWDGHEVIGNVTDNPELLGGDGRE